MYLVLELELRGLWGAWASDHKGPNKPDERAVMSSASRRRDNTSDGGGVSVTGVALEHHHDVIWWDRVQVCLVEQHAQWLRKCGE